MSKEVALNNKIVTNEDFLEAHPEDRQAIALQMIGQQQAFQLIQNFSTTASVAVLKEIRDHKLYKGLRMQSSVGEFITVNSFDEFCKAIGRSRSIVNEDIQNLNVFGQAFLESAAQMGLGYKELRRLRALPQGELEQLGFDGEALSNDPEELKDVIADYVAKAQAEEATAKEAKAEAQAKDKVLSQKNKQLDALQTELARLKNLKPDEEAAHNMNMQKDALQRLHYLGTELLGCFGQYLAQVNTVLQDDALLQETSRMVVDLTSGLCSTMARNLFDAGVDIDFRVLTYPLELGPLDLRGDNMSESNLEGYVLGVAEDDSDTPAGEVQ